MCCTSAVLVVGGSRECSLLLDSVLLGGLCNETVQNGRDGADALFAVVIASSTSLSGRVDTRVCVYFEKLKLHPPRVRLHPVPSVPEVRLLSYSDTDVDVEPFAPRTRRFPAFGDVGGAPTVFRSLRLPASGSCGAWNWCGFAETRAPHSQRAKPSVRMGDSTCLVRSVADATRRRKFQSGFQDGH